MLLGVLALLAATTASAGLQPVRRDLREAAQPRVRAGVIHVPSAKRHGLTRVIVRLSEPPLAAWRQ